MKKLLFKILLCFVIAAVPAAFFAACSCKKTDSGSKTASDFEFRLTQDGYVIRSYNGKSTNVVIPSTYKGKNVVGIGDYAFDWCDDITSIEIPSTITTIGEAAFDHCASLQSITIPSSVVLIENNAFNNCASLSSVTFADGSNLKTIEEYAFANCYSLSSITLPAKLSSISPNAFYGCSKLESLSVDSANQTLDSRNNCNAVIETQTNTLVLATKSTRSIPNTVEKIGDNAFYGAKITSIAFPQSLTEIGYQAFAYSNLTSISISSGITTIGNNAFCACENLANVNFDAACTLAEIPSGCFYDCSNLTSITIPDSVTAIRYGAFRNTGLTSVSFGQNPTLTTIGDYAFENCYSLTSITIPASVTTINYEAFYGCENLAEIVLAENSSLQKIGEEAFRNTAITSFTIPASVTELGDGAFKSCEDLEVVSFATGSTLTSIPEYCFQYCYSLSSVTAPQIRNIFEYAFDDCGALSSFNFDNVGYIGYYAFSGTGLTSVTIKSGADVYYGAFENCKSLSSVVIEEGVTEIPNYIFNGCANLTSVTLPSTLTSIGEGAFQTCDSLQSITLPESLQEIGSHTFSSCYALKSITIPNLVQVIRENTFYSCNSLTSITLPISLTTIESCAFYDCGSLGEITIPANVSEISGDAFDYCYNLSTVYILSDNMSNAVAVLNALVQSSITDYTSVTVYVAETLYEDLNRSYGTRFVIDIDNSIESMFDLELAASGQSYTITNYKSGIKNVNIPSTYNNLPITKIAANTFKNSSIESVNIPSTITEVGENAFEGCSKLVKITVETEDDAVLPVVLHSIASYNFDGDVYVWDCMTALAQATKTEDGASYSVKTIDDSMFSFKYDSKTETYTITGLNKNVASNSKLALYIPATHEGHKIIGVESSAFYYNDYIISLSFSPKSELEVIGNRAFDNCTNLQTISLPSTLTKIGNLSFAYTSIKSIAIPASVTSISSSAFSDCSQLESISVDPLNTVYDSRDNCNAVIETATNKFVVTCKNSVIPLSITEIADKMFYGASFTSFTIPSHITRIGSSAFAHCGNLQSITIPASVEIIDDGAFEWATSLGTIEFESGSHLQSIGKQAFYQCWNLSSITLPASLVTLGDSAFSSCNNLESISFASQSQLKTIGGYAFSDTRISSIYIPASVSNISANAFMGTKLQTIEIDPNNPYYSFSNNCLVETSSGTLTYVFGDTAEIPAGVKIIGSYAFSGKQITSIQIPASVTTIASYAFDGCSSLKTITFEQGSRLTTIGECAFQRTVIDSIVLPEGLTTLGHRAFCYCNSLQSVVIPSSLSSIDYQTFGDCNSLTQAKVLATSEEVLSQVMYSGWGGICYYLDQNENSTLEVWDYLASYADEQKSKYDWSFTISTISADSIVNLELNQAETGYIVTGLASDDITSIVLPNSFNKLPITEIGANAFAENSTIKSVTLPSSITTIGDRAFYGCSSLSSVSVPSTLQTIGTDAFAGTQITEISIPASITSISNIGLDSDAALNKITLLSADETTLKSLCDQISEFFTTSNKQVLVLVNMFEAISDYCAENAYQFTLDILWSAEPLETVWSFERNSTGYTAYYYRGESADVLYVPGEYNGVPVTAVGQITDPWTSRSFGRIVLPSSITIIGNEAFSNKGTLVSVNIPSGVTTIGERAFSGCSSLSSITIPASVTSIGSKAFSGCRALQTISVATGNTSYSSAGNCLIDLNSKTLIKGTSSSTIPTDGSVEVIGEYAFANTAISQITIPNTVTTISNYAFYQCSSLTSITIPASVTSIGYTTGDDYNIDGGHTFCSCSSLQTVEFESGINLKTIPNHAFMGIKIQTITIPASVETIEYGAFSGWDDKGGTSDYRTLTSVVFEPESNLKTIGQFAFSYQDKLTAISLPNGLTSIEPSAFNECSSLASISIPESVTSIGSGAFSGCSSLQTILVAAGNTKYSSQGNCLIDTTTKTLVVGTASSSIPTDGSVEIIGESAFQNSTITSITIPASVKTIGNSAFYGSSLKTITFAAGSALETIDSSAFYGCNLGSIDLSSCLSLTEISGYAFQDCGNLRTVVLPQGLTTIGEYAFAYGNLQQINIPASVTNFGSYAIATYDSSNCTITIETEDETVLTQTILPRIHDTWNSCKLLVWDSVYQDAVDYKNNYGSSFYVVLNYSLARALDWEIDSELQTATITGYNSAKTDIELPVSYNGNTVRIGENAFSGANLTSITLKTEEATELTTLATDLNGSGFTGTLYVWDSVYADANSVASGYTVARIDDSMFTFSLNSETDTYTITGYDTSYSENAKNVVIPSTHDGKKVTAIGSNAFESKKDIISVSFSPKSELTTISSNAFYYCQSLTSIELPSTVSSIGNYAFYYCQNLATISLPSTVSTIGNNAFYNCQNLAEITLPAAIETIGNSAFCYCSSLASIDLSACTNLTQISRDVFNWCSNLTSVVLPSSIQTIDVDAFYECRSLASITLPSALTTIGVLAFHNTALTSLFVPASVTSIANNAFSNCRSLATISVDNANTVFDSRDNCNAVIETATNKFVVTSKNTTIPSSITEIPDYAFQNSAITSISIPNTVTKIGDYAFYNCSALTSITIPASVTSIGTTSIHHEDDYYGGNTFYGCSSLRTVIFESGINLAEIPYCAFYGCSALTSITIPASVSTIGREAFKGCSSLSNIEVEAANQTYYAKTGCLIERSTKTLVAVAPSSFTIPQDILAIGDYCFDNSSISSISIPEGVVTIGKCAFASCSNLSSISIPASVQVIDSYAFDNSNISSLQFAQNSSLTTIGRSAFHGTQISSVTIPASVQTLKENSFGHCRSLSSVQFEQNSQLNTIESGAFYYTVLTSITIPASVTKLSGFRMCYNLQSVTLEQGSRIKELTNAAFQECNCLTSITLPEGLETIGDSAFQSCSALSSVAIPSTVKVIKQYAFQSTIIATLVLPEGLTTLGYRAFCYCNNLQSVVIPSSLSSIDSQTFGDCNSLASAKVLVTDESVLSTIIGSGWFDGIGYYLSQNENSTLEVWDYLAQAAEERKSSYGWSFTISTISADSVVNLELNQAETGYIVTGVKSQNSNIVFPSTYNNLPITEIGANAFENNTAITSVVLPSSITTISAGAFSGCSSLESISIPSAVTSIDANAFSGCTKLTSLTIPNSVETIGQNAFSGCTSLTEIAIPASVTSVASLGFATCTQLSKITLYSTNETTLKSLCDQISEFFTTSDKQVAIIVNLLETITDYVQAQNYGFETVVLWSIGPIEETWRFSQYGDGYSIIGYSGSDTVVYVPGEYNGKPVTRLRSTFSHNYRDITRVVLPSTITEIGEYTFYYCTSLAQIDIPSGVTTIDQYAFNNCSALTSITIPASVTSIGENAFRDCIKLSTVIFEQGSQLTTIGQYAFDYCSALTSISIPVSVTSIGDSAFYYCSALTSITIPSSLTSIGSGAFSGCRALQTITVESGNTKYSSQGNCLIDTTTKTLVVGTASSTIPTDGSVEIIGESAFQSSTITSITIPASVKTIGSSAFYGSSLKTITFAPGSALETIGRSAFSSCNSLSSIDLSSCLSLTEIGGYAFQNCDNLKIVVLPQGLTTIGEWAFAYGYLQQINIPASVTSFGYYAIYSYSSDCAITIETEDEAVLTQTILPRIHETWNSCTLLVWDAVYSAAVSYKENNSSSFTVELNFDPARAFDWEINSELQTATITGYNSIATDIELPVVYNGNTVRIGENAFSGSNLNSITLQTEDATELTTLATDLNSSGFTGTLYVWDSVYSDVDAIASGYTVARIDDSMFTFEDETVYNDQTGEWEPTGNVMITGYNSSSKEVVIPSTHMGKKVTTIASNVFADKYLTNVIFSPKSELTTIRQSSFSNNNFNEIIFPATVTYIDEGAFRGCSQLTAITIPEFVTYIGDAVFYGCNSITNISIPASVSHIGSQAFTNMQSLVSITVDVGNTVYHAQDNCLIETATNTLISGCKNSIIPNGIATIATHAFEYSKLTSITIPASVASINFNAFYNCNQLTEIIFSSESQLQTIGEQAFASCSKLTSIALPASVTSINSSAFNYCTSLQSIEMQNNGNEIYSCPQGSNIIIERETGNFVVVCKNSTIPQGTTAIPNYAFQNSAISLISIPNTVLSIGNYAFQSSALTSITIPASVTSIGESAFEHCSSLTEVIFESGSQLQSIGQNAFAYDGAITSISAIPSSVTTIGSYAFRNTHNLHSITFEANSSLTQISGNAFTYCYGLTAFEVPYGVTSIGDYAFQDCSNLQTITIPSTVTSISSTAFAGCNNLTTIDCSNNSYYSFENGCLVEKSTKTLMFAIGNDFVVPQDILIIADYCFSGKTFTSFTIPITVTTIGSYAFYNCNGLTQITIPSTVTTIKSYAFDNCSNLQAINFEQESSLTTIEEYAFQSTIIATLVLPEGLTTLGYRAFCYCNNLQSVVIPSSLSSIDSQTFGDCNRLASVKVLVTDESVLSTIIGSGWFNGIGYYLNQNTGTIEVVGSKTSFVESIRDSYGWNFTVTSD